MTKILVTRVRQPPPSKADNPQQPSNTTDDSSAQTLSPKRLEEDFRMQLMLLDQQNKNRTGYEPAIVDGSQRPRRLSGRIRNLFMGSEGLMTCEACIEHTYHADNSLWPDLKRHIHIALPSELKTDPDLHQCFCGYYSFLPNGLQDHLSASAAMTMASRMQDSEDVKVELISRIERAGMHEECQQQLITFVQDQEYVRRVQQGNHLFDDDDNDDDDDGDGDSEFGTEEDNVTQRACLPGCEVCQNH